MSKSSETNFVVAMDTSTSAVKLMAYALTGAVLGIIKVPLHYLNLPDGRREIDPKELIEAVRTAFLELWQLGLNPNYCEGFAAGGAMHGMCLVDEQGNYGPNIVCWDDPRHTEISKRLSEILGIPIPNRFTVCRTIGCYQDGGLDGFVPFRVFTPSCFVLSQLIGVTKAVSLPGDYTGMTGWLKHLPNLPSSGLDDAVKSICPDLPGFSSLLPNVARFGDNVGVVTREGALLTGLPEGTPCAPSCGDQPLGSVGKGCTRKGDISIELGSSIVANAFGFKPIFNQLGLIEALISSLGVEHAMCCVTNGCQSWDDFVESLTTLAYSVSPSNWNSEKMLHFLEERLRSTKPGSDGLFALPFFRQEGALRLFGSSVSPGFLGISQENYTLQNMARAWMEAPIFILQRALNMITAGQDIGRIIVSGGGANGYWPQIVSDILQRPVTVPETTEAVLMGAALNALCMVNRTPLLSVPDFVDQHVRTKLTFLPNKEVENIYRELSPRFFAATDGLKGFWNVS